LAVSVTLRAENTLCWSSSSGKNDRFKESDVASDAGRTAGGRCEEYSIGEDAKVVSLIRSSGRFAVFDGL